jgi:Rrf2 family protein
MSLFHISDATRLGWHAMAYLAKETDKSMSVQVMAKGLGVSSHHLAKVMQQLTRSGLVTGQRGPRGGFQLQKKAGEISLGEIYAGVEPAQKKHECLLGHSVCKKLCGLTQHWQRVERELMGYISTMTLAEFAGQFRPS